MKWHRIWGITLRHLFLFKHSLNRFSDMFYWPTIDLLIWGLTSQYFTTYAPNTSKIILIVLSGEVLWLIAWRGQYEISVNFLEELWNKNLINMFSTPLTFSEWMVSLVVQGVIKGIVSFGFAVFLAFFFYRLKLFLFGFYLVPFILLLLMSGWTIGCLASGIILRFGSRMEQLAWSLAWIIGPFSAIFYPVSVLPAWAQKISAVIPTSYVFEGAREVIATGALDWSKVYISFILNVVYLSLSLWFLRRSFDRVLEKGLVKMI